MVFGCAQNVGGSGGCTQKDWKISLGGVRDAVPITGRSSHEAGVRDALKNERELHAPSASYTPYITSHKCFSHPSQVHLKHSYPNPSPADS